MSRERWEATLRDLERDLELLQAAIDDLEKPSPAATFTPRDDLGPIPPDLVRRAIGLADAYDKAISKAEEETARITEELRRLPRSQSDAVRGRSRVDYTS
jgi:hypothetical protein